MADVSQIVLKDANGNVIGTYDVKDASVPHDSKAAASGGTTLSLVTTGEKYSWNNKMDKTNPSGSGTFSLGRKSGSNIGDYSVAIGFGSEARGNLSTAIGAGVIAKNAYQHVIGRFNIEDPGSSVPSTVGTYAEIVGNGMGSDSSLRSNARTLDWDGNEVLAGGLKLNGTEDVITTSKSASSGGTDLSLVTTGEKYTWNNKSNPLLVSSVAISINYGGKRYAATTMSVAKSGYTVLGTVGYQMSSIDNCVFRCDTNGNNLTVGIFTRNGVATSEIATGYVFVLYVKQ